MARGRKRNKEIARVDMKNGVYGGCKDYNTRCTSGEFLSSFLFFFFCLSPLFSFFIFIFAVFSISARLLRGNGLDVLVSYKVKINFLIQRLIESSRCVSHIGASGARSLFFFFPHQIRFSKLIDQLCRPARSKRTRGKKGK